MPRVFPEAFARTARRYHASTMTSRLTNRHIEQGRPILNGLKSETDQNQANTKNPHAFFGHSIGHPFDKWSAGAGDSRDHANGESGFHSDGDRVFPPLRDQAADAPGSPVADSAIHRG